MRYRVIGSNHDAMCSVDLVASSEDEAIEKFNATMGLDRRLYSRGRPSAVDVDADSPFSNPGTVTYTRNSWKEGKVWTFGGY